MTLTAAEHEALQLGATLSGTLSMLGSGFVLYHLLRHPEEETKLSNALVLVLSVMDMVASAAFALGRAGADAEGLCQLQGFLIQWAALASVLWNCAIAYNLYKWVVKRKSVARILEKLRYYVVVCVLVPLILAVGLSAGGAVGFANLWCWIDSTHQPLRFWCFYSVVVTAWCYSTATFLSVFVEYRRRLSAWRLQTTMLASSSGSSSSSSSGRTVDESKLGVLRQLLPATELTESVVQRRLVQFVGVFVITWMFGLINRITQYSSGEAQFSTSLLHVLFVPSQGLFNAIVYGGLLDEDSAFSRIWNRFCRFCGCSCAGLCAPMRACCAKFQQQNAKPHTRDSSNAIEVMPTYPYAERKFSLFLTTYNMAEGTEDLLTSAALSTWLLPGHDMYVIGMQECLELDGVRSVMHKHLGTSKYVMYTNEIGSSNTRLGFHGFIGLTVYVRKEEVDARHIIQSEAATKEVRRGANLGVARAANKGGIGLAFQIHDVSVAFLTAHFASDSKGRSRVRKRNVDAYNILRDVVLVPDEIGFDCHLHHDATFILGDLNYRVPAAPERVLQMVAAAASAELFSDGNADWVQSRYNQRLAARSRMRHRSLLAHVLPPGTRERLISSDGAGERKGDRSHGNDDADEENEDAQQHNRDARRRGGAHKEGRFRRNIRGRRNSGKVDLPFFARKSLEADPEGLELTPPNQFDSRKSFRASLSGVLKGKMSGSTAAMSTQDGDPAVHEDEDPRLGSVRDDDDDNNDNSNNDDDEDDRRHLTTEQPTKSAGHAYDEHADGEANDAVADAEADADDGSVADDPPANSAEQQAAERWDRLFEHEELVHQIADGLALTGFREPPIRFPPSYRREKDRNCGDYSSIEQLFAGFTTNTAPTGNDSLTDAGSTPAGTTELVGVRPPSYTDRILLHTLSDQSHRVDVRGYELCDNMMGSDHRPVSMVCHLAVNKAVSAERHPNQDAEFCGLFCLSIACVRLEIFETEDDDTLGAKEGKDGGISDGDRSKSMGAPPGAGASHMRGASSAAGSHAAEALRQKESRRRQVTSLPSALRSGPSSIAVEQALSATSKSSARMDSSARPTGEESMFREPPTFRGNTRKPHELHVAMPLLSEDPLQFLRKAHDFATNLGRNRESASERVLLRDGYGQVFGADISQLLNVHTRFDYGAVERGTQHVLCYGMPALGLHALLRVADATGQDIGQGVVCVTELLEPSEEGSDRTESHALEVPLSLGGRETGILRAVFHAQSLVLLPPDALHGENAHGRIAGKGSSGPTLSSSSKTAVNTGVANGSDRQEDATSGVDVERQAPRDILYATPSGGSSQNAVKNPLLASSPSSSSSSSSS